MNSFGIDLIVFKLTQTYFNDYICSHGAKEISRTGLSEQIISVGTSPRILPPRKREEMPEDNCSS